MRETYRATIIIIVDYIRYARPGIRTSHTRTCDLRRPPAHGNHILESRRSRARARTFCGFETQVARKCVHQIRLAAMVANSIRRSVCLARRIEAWTSVVSNCNTRAPRATARSFALRVSIYLRCIGDARYYPGRLREIMPPTFRGLRLRGCDGHVREAHKRANFHNATISYYSLFSSPPSFSPSSLSFSLSFCPPEG